MINIDAPIKFNVRTIGLDYLDFLNTAIRIHREIAIVNNTTIDETIVDVKMYLFNVEDQHFYHDVTEWSELSLEESIANNNVRHKNNLRLLLVSNRFVFNWFGQNLTDIGAFVEKFEEVIPAVYDGLKVKPSYVQEPVVEKEESWFDTGLKYGKQLVDTMVENKAELIKVGAIAIIGTLIYRNATASILEATTEAIETAVKSIEPPTIEIFIDEYGKFHDAVVENVHYT